ncbi:MAG: agmatine deiminase family protein [Rhodospirillaceae bacterium]|nr:agmatine deiminase family protein [Rhodospirillaceae bacterium]MBT6118849.1 agmatine deiminase family protein [Rhodospirillaceae bacterium]
MRDVAGLAFLSGAPSSRAGARSGNLGFRLPDEADPHQRTFMQWPVSRAVYPDPVFLGMLQQSIADIANAISQFEPVVMLMAEKYRKAARGKLSSAIEIWDIPTDDLWCRDSGPVFVKDNSGALGVSLLNFNGWGNKQTHANDGQVARRVAERLALPIFDNGLVGEAGGVDSDGRGTLIAHESSWVIENRNKTSKARIERLLLEALGAEKLTWAPGLEGADITDYHIDSLARFTKPGHVLIQLPKAIDPNDSWSVSAFETYEILKQATDAEGNRLSLTIIPEPYDTRITSRDFVASYVNYYVCNGAVIAAQFGDEEADAEATAVLAAAYPEREIVTLDIDPIGETGGGIHCATQQQPTIQDRGTDTARHQSVVD